MDESSNGFALLSSDDVAIRCRILRRRQAPTAKEAKGSKRRKQEADDDDDETDSTTSSGGSQRHDDDDDQETEMICTLREYRQQEQQPQTAPTTPLHKPKEMNNTRSFTDSFLQALKIKKKPDPELVLTPLLMPHPPKPTDNNHNASGSGKGGGPRRRRRTTAPSPPSTPDPRCVTISLPDVVQVDRRGRAHGHLFGERERDCTTILVTRRQGTIRFAMDHQNGHDILLAFLSSRLPANRFVTDDEDKPSTRDVSLESEDDLLNVETFTASRLADRVQRETVAEKMQRRIGKVWSSIGEFSASFSECACLCGSQNHEPDASTKKRPESDLELFAQFEVPDDSASSCFPGGCTSADRRLQMLGSCALPSGLSVEMATSSVEERSMAPPPAAAVVSAVPPTLPLVGDV